MRIRINKTLFLLVSILCIVFVMVIIGLNFGYKKKDNNNRSNEISLSITDFEIKDRVVLKIDKTIYVGEKENEIQNGYFDIKITSVDGNVNIYFNKLWYEKYNEDYIQEDYLARIIRELVTKLNIEDNKEDIEYELYKYILENYLKVKEGGEVKVLKLDGLQAELKNEEKMAKLILKGE